MKWIIVVTLESGTRMGVSGKDGSLALVPIHGPTVNNVFAFDSEDEARAWILKFYRLNPTAREKFKDKLSIVRCTEFN